MTKQRQKRIGWVRAMIIGLFFILVSSGFFYPQVISKAFENDFFPKLSTRTNKTGFAQFSHSGRSHSRLSCNACHTFPTANWRTVRKKADAFPDVTDYPKHESCLKCHRQDFFSKAKPNICSVCHTNPGPRNSSRHPFPNPREIFDLSAKGKQAVSDFEIFFPHDKHIEIVSQNDLENGGFINSSFAPKRNRTGEESCAVCHQTHQPQGGSDEEFLTKPPANLGDSFWLKKGTFKTSPISHATCFSCHSPDTGILPAPTNCAACHKLAQKLPRTDFDAKTAAATGNLDRISLLAWRKRDSSAVFRHEFSSHADLECANCHNAATMNTTDFLTKKVAVTSCNMCHITATSDDGGILNYEIDERKKNANFQCVKCHLAFGKLPIPESHFKAIADLAGN